MHAAVDTLGYLLALAVTPASDDERTQVATLAAAHGIRPEVVKLPEAKRGFVLLPKRCIVERSFAWAARFRRLARDYERLPCVRAGLHFLAFACLMLHQFIHLSSSS